MLRPTDLEEVLRAVGDLLGAEGEVVAIVVVGGASLSLLGLVPRTTSDVDVLARAEPAGEAGDPAGASVLVPPEPLPGALTRAIATVARDFGLPADWMNTVIGRQWDLSLPPTLPADLDWRRFGGLRVGLAGRRTLVALKLYAAIDQGPESVHVQDLLALAPTDAELSAAAQWVGAQDASPGFARFLDEVIRYVQRRRS
jgi:hypothetical protein